MDGSEEEIRGWFAGRIPQDWFSGPPEVATDRDEILVIGTLPDVEVQGDSADARESARAGRIRQHREDTRQARMRIADEAQHRFRRKVSWGARCGDSQELFTTLSLPVMTRLRMEDREVLDTLISAGVARSRSEALAWCVRLVGRNEADWISGLKDALASVQRARETGPTIV